MQVINTSLLSDAQHIEQMNRQFHPSQRGQSVPEPTPDADGLSHMHSGSGSLSAGDPLTGTALGTELFYSCQLASVPQKQACYNMGILSGCFSYQLSLIGCGRGFKRVFGRKVVRNAFVVFTSRALSKGHLTRCLYGSHGRMWEGFS